MIQVFFQPFVLFVNKLGKCCQRFWIVDDNNPCGPSARAGRGTVYSIDNPINTLAWNRFVFVPSDGTTLLQQRKKLVVINIKLLDRGEFLSVQTFHMNGKFGADSGTVTTFQTKANTFR